MYIIYESSLDTYKNLVIYEGFDRSQNELTTRTVSGLFVPTTFGAKTSVLAWEGDETLNVNYASGVAESLSFGAGQPPSAITNTFNLGGTGTTPRSGIFNSTISTGGSSGPTAADAGRDDAFGVDFDTFDVTTKTSSGATSGTLNIQGSQDLFYISSVALMIAGGVDDLSLTKTVSNATPIQGSTITYTITLHNDGPDPSAGPGVPTENVEVKDVLPAGVTYVSSSAAAGTYDPATGIWSVLSPIAGEATTLTITATATGAGPITNVAEVISSPQPDSDSKTDNGVTTEDDYASVTVVIPSADLGITKTGKAFVQPGETITYTLTVTNGGPTAASAVAVTDTLPAGVAFVSSVPAPGSVSGQTLSWDFADLAANATQVITVTATTPTTATLASTPAVRSFTNTASVSSATTDPVSSNNSAAASTNTVYGNLIKEVRNVTKGTAFGTSGGGLPGEILEYCVGFENLGGAALPNFVIVDHVPGSTNALTTAYDADEGSAITGFGVKLTRSTLTSYLSSDADTDGGSLTTTGGTFTRGTMTVSLGTLASGESGRTCFQTTIR
ncbi:DUF11 domain-containing protein [Deinococcus sp.]|uniref:DUF11 domain-containing protein n=1 Tax=Deinococcus sp. TaxID=47478 RepID=UPI0025B9EF01|nr:DUF11 domain-containing protein [Deinococcus sp.]